MSENRNFGTDLIESMRCPKVMYAYLSEASAIRTGWMLDGRGTAIRFTAGARGFCFLHIIVSGSGAPSYLLFNEHWKVISFEG
jgi:hypothetical protein